MEDAPNTLSLFGYTGRGFAVGALLGILLLAMGVSDPYPLPDRVRDGDALIGYPVAAGLVGACTGLLFGGLKKLLDR